MIFISPQYNPIPTATSGAYTSNLYALETSPLVDLFPMVSGAVESVTSPKAGVNAPNAIKKIAMVAIRVNI